MWLVFIFPQYHHEMFVFYKEKTLGLNYGRYFLLTQYFLSGIVDKNMGKN